MGSGKLQTKVAVGATVEATMAVIVDAVAQSHSVTLSGFGTFEPKAREPRTGRNPRTGDSVPIPARIVPAFRPGNAFRSAVE